MARTARATRRPQPIPREDTDDPVTEPEPAPRPRDPAGFEPQASGGGLRVIPWANPRCTGRQIWNRSGATAHHSICYPRVESAISRGAPRGFALNLPGGEPTSLAAGSVVLFAPAMTWLEANERNNAAGGRPRIIHHPLNGISISTTRISISQTTRKTIGTTSGVLVKGRPACLAASYRIL